MRSNCWRACAVCCSCTLEAGEGGLSSLEMLVLEVPQVIRCVLLCMLEAVEGRLMLLGLLEVPEMMRCALLDMLEAVEVGSVRWRCWRYRR